MLSENYISFCRNIFLCVFFHDILIYILPQEGMKCILIISNSNRIMHNLCLVTRIAFPCYFVCMPKISNLSLRVSGKAIKHRLSFKCIHCFVCSIFYRDFSHYIRGCRSMVMEIPSKFLENKYVFTMGKNFHFSETSFELFQGYFRIKCVDA